MKSEEEVRNRLLKLKKRYLKKRLNVLQERTFRNCLHNKEIIPENEYLSDFSTDMDIAPRKQTTLIVFNPQVSSFICMHDSSLQGSICDSKEIATSCPSFSFAKNEEQISYDFESVLSNDKETLKHYPDIASLQWVLEERVSRYSRIARFFGRLKLIFYISMIPRIQDDSRSDTL